MFRGNKLFVSRLALRQAFVGGIAQCVSAVGIVLSLVYLPGPIAIIIAFSHTLMLMFYSAWRGALKLNVSIVITTVLALLGLMFVLDVWHAQPTSNLIGYALAFAAALATVVRLYIYGEQAKTRHPILLGAESYVIASVLTLLTLFWQMPVAPQSWKGWVYLALAAGVMTVTTFAMFYGVKLLGAFRWSLFLKLEPVFTALFSALLLNEILKPSQYLGIAIVLASLVAYQISHRYKKTSAS